MSKQHDDPVLRTYAMVSVVWPLLLALGVLSQDLMFTWIAIGYMIPLAILGTLRILANPE